MGKGFTLGPSLRADPLYMVMAAKMQAFGKWLQQNDAKGYIGEVGWPSEPLDSNVNPTSNMTTEDDAKKWNFLGSMFFGYANLRKHWVTGWATGERFEVGYNKNIYEKLEADVQGTVGTKRRQAEVYETHVGSELTSGKDEKGDPKPLPKNQRPLRGLNLAGGEFQFDDWDPTQSYSIKNPGTQGFHGQYRYPTFPSLQYLSQFGYDLIRVPFRWEVVQDGLSGALRPSAIADLEQVAADAHTLGFKVIFDLHNYGAVYLPNSAGGGTRHPLGGNDVTIEHFADLWRKLASALKDREGVLGFGLMNEPHGMPGGPITWEAASREAVKAIRNAEAGQCILVGSYDYNGTVEFPLHHGGGAWINDPIDNVRYEAHIYFNEGGTGKYGKPYATEQGLAQAWLEANEEYVALVP